MHPDRPYIPYLIAGPQGLVYIGLHRDETETWKEFLGGCYKPLKSCIAEAESKGFYCAKPKLEWEVFTREMYEKKMSNRAEEIRKYWEEQQKIMDQQDAEIEQNRALFNLTSKKSRRKISTGKN